MSNEKRRMSDASDFSFFQDDFILVHLYQHRAGCIISPCKITLLSWYHFAHLITLVPKVIAEIPSAYNPH